MSNIILNGTNSNTIQGLIIGSLAPISKPNKRTIIEEIDGRDGDIITDLGYGAVDKVITVGLIGSYDINEVIAYFDSEGTVVFSNEPDKVYNYKIIEEIDWNHIIDYREGEVTLHCQPFKYLKDETPIDYNTTVISGEGTSFILNGTEADKPFIDLKIEGDSYQYTTEGKNLIDTNNFETINLRGLTITMNPDGTFNITGRSTSTGNIQISNNMTSKLIEGHSYAEFLGAEYGANLNISCYLSYTGGSTSITPNAYKTIPANLNNAYLRLYVSSVGVDYDYHNLKIMIGEGTSLTEDDWEPFTDGVSPNPEYPQIIKSVTESTTIKVSNEDESDSQNYSVLLENIEILKIGNNQDIIYRGNGKYYIRKKIKKIELNGSESWRRETTSTAGEYRFSTPLNNSIASDTTTPNSMSTHFQLLVTGGTSIGYGYTISSNGRMYIRIPSISTVTDFKNWLSQNEPVFYYVQNNFEDIEIVDSNLISQLDDFFEARTYETKTKISSTGDLAPIIYAEVWDSSSSSLIVNNTGNTYAKPIMTIYGKGTCGIYLNGNQAFSINLDEENIDHITIDCEQMEAYKDTLEFLRNRDVTGDYSNFLLTSGNNTISFTGNVSRFRIEKYNRWI